MKNQYGYYLPDQEFAEKWKQFPSPMLMANEIKMSPRSVQNRRRSVEVRLGIKLETEINPRDDYNKKQKEEPCDYESFNDFLNWVSYRTEDTIHYKIIENEKLKLDLEQERKFRKMILDFIYNNFSDDVKYYYDKYRKIICPKK